MNPLYERLIERDLAAVPEAAEALDDDELFLAVARFAVLAYSPSQHGKHSLIACLAAHDLREDLGARFRDVVIECARYVAEARQPWSEPPPLDPPPPAADGDISELRAAVAEGDRLRAERWLSRRHEDDGVAGDLLQVACDDFEDLGHKLIVTRTVLRLLPVLGGKGKFALLRVATTELTAYRGARWEARGNTPDEDALAERLVANAVAERGAVDAAHHVFLFDAGRDIPPVRDYLASLVPARVHATGSGRRPPIETLVYRLATDYAELLIASAVAKRIPNGDAFVAAAYENLQQAGFDQYQ